jgi:hypothetical protein
MKLPKTDASFIEETYDDLKIVMMQDHKHGDVWAWAIFRFNGYSWVLVWRQGVDYENGALALKDAREKLVEYLDEVEFLAEDES